MGIAQKVARNFSDAVRSRGQVYLAKGRVSLMSAKPNEVVAKVRGTTKYRVRVRLRGAKLLASCSCPYFSPQGEPCKHLWATLLLADSRGFLQTAPSFAVRFIPELPRKTAAPGSLPGIRIEPTHPHESYPSVDADLGMNMGGERLPRSNARLHGRAPPRIVQCGRAEQVVRRVLLKEGWVGSGVTPGSVPRDRRPGSRSAARSVLGPAARAKPINRNAKRLLVYVLDVAATQSHNQVVVDLARRQRKPTGEWGPLRPWWYAPRAAHVKYDPEDRLLLALLDEAHHGTSSHSSQANSSAGNGVATSSAATTTPGPGCQRSAGNSPVRPPQRPGRPCGTACQDWSPAVTADRG